MLANLCWSVANWSLQVHPNPILRMLVPALPAGAPLLDITQMLPQALLAPRAPDITCLIGCSAQVLFPVTLQPQLGTVQIIQLDRVIPGCPGRRRSVLYFVHCSVLRCAALHCRL